MLHCFIALREERYQAPANGGLGKPARHRSITCMPTRFSAGALSPRTTHEIVIFKTVHGMIGAEQGEKEKRAV